MKKIRLRQLEETESICPSCHKRIQARIVTDENAVFLEKNCSEHGPFRGSIWTDYDLYQQSYRFLDYTDTDHVLGSQDNPMANVIIENLQFKLQQRTCLALLEVTDRCNLGCPVCVANSSNLHGDLPLLQIEWILKSLRDKRNHNPPIQISGGEPTVRKDLPRIVCLAKKLNFEFVEVNTNGLEIGRRADLAWQLADSGLDGIYLQFDGLNGRAHEVLRGKDLLTIKQKAIENCLDVGMSVTLASTIIKGVNDDQIWPIIEYGIAQGALGVNFQPFTSSGRFPVGFADPVNKVTASDIIRAVEKQSEGRVLANDFVPIPCQDNRCALILYGLIESGELIPLNRKIDPSLILDHYARLNSWEKILRSTEKILHVKSGRCNADEEHSKVHLCCPNEKTIFPEGYFSIGCHDFMDSINFDLVRARKCCMHELTPEGNIVPFCLYNMLRNNDRPI